MQNRIEKNLKIHVESPQTGFVSFCQEKYLSPSLLTDLKEKNVDAVPERETKFCV